MNKINVNVPDNVEFLSEWTEFDIPSGHTIIDKTLCGCGFTEWCISCPRPLILCSPRKILLENKKKQHPEESVYYFKNEKVKSESFDNPGVDKDEVDALLMTEDKTDLKAEYLTDLKTRLYDFVDYCSGCGVVPKILVTYDSLHHVLSALGKYVGEFTIVVDEFQAIFMDSSFKASVELDFMQDLNGCSNDVCFVSATPMLDEYLDMLDDFKSLPFYKLIWPDFRTENIRIEYAFERSVQQAVGRYITNYKLGLYKTKTTSDGVEHISNELVIFCNSVKAICSIIVDNGLTLENTNVICADTETNKKRLRKAFGITARDPEYTKGGRGEVPLKGEPNKMFTFCTRTAYLGADFYSPCAYAIICSDCNIETMTVDISLDLPQIIGRQRMKENVFRNEILFIYKAKNKQDSVLDITDEEFNALMEKRERESWGQLDILSNCKDDLLSLQMRYLRLDIAKMKYQTNFIGVDRDGHACYNYFVKVSALRARKVLTRDYQSEVCIKRCIEEKEGFRMTKAPDPTGKEILDRFRAEFEHYTFFDDRMKVYCRYYKNYPDVLKYYENILVSFIPMNYQSYMFILGPERIIALSCEEKAIKNEINRLKSTDKIMTELKKEITIKKRYSLKELKEIFKRIYNTLGLVQTPKATDILEFYEVKKVRFQMDGVGPYENGYLILKVKE